MDLSGTFVVPQAHSVHVSVKQRGRTFLNKFACAPLASTSATPKPGSRRIRVNSREQVEPLLFGDGLLPQQLQYYGTHQLPFVLKLKGAFVLKTDRREVNYLVQTVREI